MSAHAWLAITNVSPEEWCAVIDGTRKLLGRSHEAAIRIPNRFQHVSRRHAEIWADRRELWLADAGSRSGTQVNGVWVQPHRPVRVSAGDRLWMGGLELEITEDVPPLAQLLAEMNVPPDTEEAGLDTDVRRTVELSPQLVLRQLTPAELDVVLWMSRGYTDDKEIGRILFRSPHTVRTQVASVFQKLRVHSRTELLGWLRRSNVRARTASREAAAISRSDSVLD